MKYDRNNAETMSQFHTVSYVIDNIIVFQAEMEQEEFQMEGVDHEKEMYPGSTKSKTQVRTALVINL